MNLHKKSKPSIRSYRIYLFLLMCAISCKTSENSNEISVASEGNLRASAAESAFCRVDLAVTKEQIRALENAGVEINRNAGLALAGPENPFDNAPACATSTGNPLDKIFQASGNQKNGEIKYELSCYVLILSAASTREKRSRPYGTPNTTETRSGKT